MNLRKKKKRLKKQVESMRAELDSMLKQPAPVVVKRHRIETLRAVECVQLRGPEFIIPEECIHDRLNKELIKRAKEFGCITYDRRERPRPIAIFPDEYIYSAELRIVVPDGGDEF